MERVRPCVRVAVLGAAMSSNACAFAIGASAAPAVETNAQGGTEERVEGSAATGGRGARVYGTLAAGGGYLSDYRGYVLVSPELGVEGGNAIRWSAGVAYTARILLDDAAPNPLRNGIAADGALLFRAKKLHSESAGIYIGPRVSMEYIARGAPAEVDRGLFSLALVVRWVVFDTTGNSWTN
jgi:hypothetical protein